MCHAYAIIVNDIYNPSHSLWFVIVVHGSSLGRCFGIGIKKTKPNNVALFSFLNIVNGKCRYLIFVRFVFVKLRIGRGVFPQINNRKAKEKRRKKFVDEECDNGK